MKIANVLTLVVLFGGSGLILGQTLLPDLSAVRHQDSEVAARFRDLATRRVNEARRAGDARAAAFYHSMALNACPDGRS